MSDFQDELDRAKDQSQLRFHVHGYLSAPEAIDADAHFTITLDADDDEDAQALARKLLSAPFDVTEIEAVS